jgi:hypothetical protein
MVVLAATTFMLATTTANALAAEPSFGQVLDNISGEVSSDGGTIDDVISHYGGVPSEAKEKEMDRVLGEVFSLDEKYGGRSVSGSGALDQDLNELGMSSDTTMQAYLEQADNAATVREDAQSITEGEAAASEDGATTTAVGGELADAAVSSGIDPELTTAAELGVIDPLAGAATAIGVLVAAGTEYLTAYAQEGVLEHELDVAAIEGERWVRVQPGEKIIDAFHKIYGEGSYGPGGTGPATNFYYEGKGIEEVPKTLKEPLYVLGMLVGGRWYFGATAYRSAYAGPEEFCTGAGCAANEEGTFMSARTAKFGFHGDEAGDFVKPDLESAWSSGGCKENPFEVPELGAFPPHFLRHHTDLWLDSSTSVVGYGCYRYTYEETRWPWDPPQEREFVKLQGTRVVATLADLRMGFPRSTNTSGHTPEAVTVEPTEGDAGVTKAIIGQDASNESDGNVEKFMDHYEHAHSSAEETIPLLPGTATELAESLVEKNSGLKELIAKEELKKEAAEEIAERCIRDVMDSGETEAEGVDNCEKLPIFLSGSDVPSATDHDLTALAGYPQWVKLNYESAAVKEERGEKRNWYVGLGGCSGRDPTGTHCDEYPFYASKQGGPGALRMPSLEYVNKTDNEKQGGRYGNFVSSCKMAERSITEYAFLSIPLPPALEIPTIYLCN